MKILHLDCSTGFGGQERDHVAEAGCFLAKGHEYVLGVRPHSPLEEYARSKVPVLSLPFRNNFDMDSFVRIRTFLKDHAIDVLVTTSYIDSFLGPLAAFSLGSRRPLVIRQRHILNPPRNLFPYRRMCDRLVVVSDALRLFFIEKGIPFWHVVTIHRGVEESFPEMKDGAEKKVLRKNLGLPESGPVLLQVGMFQRDKGHHMTLDALKTIFRERPEIVVVFLGDGPLRDEIKARSQRMFPERSEKQIFFVGRENPLPYFQVADVLLHPSFREALGLVIIEALQNGVPVAAFRIGGIPEIFNRMSGGYLVKPFDVRAFSRTVLAVLEKKNGVTPQIFAGRNSFTLDQTVEKTLSLYGSELEHLRSGLRKSHDNPYQIIGGRADPFRMPLHPQENMQDKEAP